MKATPVPLSRAFFARPTCVVAQELLGCGLVRLLNGQRLAGLIVEAEAYIGENDLACHARAGRTPRTEVMYGPAGFSYVYFTYGMHWMLNVITEGKDFPAAVLIRALEPTEGIEAMRQRRRGMELRLLCSGPARLTEALGIVRAQNGLDLCNPASQLWIEGHPPLPSERIESTARIGISRTPEPWLSQPWRFFIKGCPFVSKAAPIPRQR